MARNWTWISTIWLSLWALTACGGCTPRTPDTPIATGEPHHESASPAPRSSERATGFAEERGATARQKASSAGSGPASAPREDYESGDARADVDRAPAWRRPGLATQWGEERESRIREVGFVRDQGAPTALLSFNYDDEDGIRAATGRTLKHAYASTHPVLGGTLTVSLVDSSGDPLPGLQSSGQRYVFGDRGDRYQIRITNHSPGRFEVVASVDGLDVIDGHDATFSKRGYVVNPWATLDIQGFRDSYETVRAFRFGNVEDSYAVSRGKGRNIGVIGVALFAERGFYAHDEELRRRRDADPFPGRFSPPPGSW